jgi:prevent-host-death family protein
MENMTTVGVRALKQNASAVVAEAAAGEVVTITDRGRPVARLVPLAQSRVADLVAAGRARPARRRLVDLGTAPKRRPGAKSLTSILQEMRDSDRY